MKRNDAFAMNKQKGDLQNSRIAIFQFDPVSGNWCCALFPDFE